MTSTGWLVTLAWLLLVWETAIATLYISVRFDRLGETVQKILHREEHIMALVRIEQDELDAFASELASAAANIAAEIAALKTSLPDADVTGLETALADLQALETPTTTT